MLSNLYDKTFTIINQIPESPKSKRKVGWKMFKLTGCDVVGAKYDRSQGTIGLESGAHNVYIKNWQDYCPSADFYETLPAGKYTLARGDLIIFEDIDIAAPTSVEEYDSLIEKYVDTSLTVSDFEVFVNYKRNGMPWRTNHIEVMKN